MELDPFTKKLLERCKARRELLDKIGTNMQSGGQRKRQSPMSEIVNFSSVKEDCEDSAAEHCKEDSPKRQCKDASKGEDLSCDKENISNEQKVDSSAEVNAHQKNQDSQALKRKSPNNDGGHMSTFSKQICFEKKSQDAAPSQARQGCRKRLAALANQINQWEDETSQFPTDSCASKSTRSSSNSVNPWPSANQTNKASFREGNDNTTSKANSNLPTAATSTKNSSSDSDLCKDKPLALQSSRETTLPVSVKATTGGTPSPKKILKNEQQVRKVHIWDSAILTTLESQGFTKSPSASKLQYDYNTKQQLPQNQKLESINENAELSTTAADTASSAPKKIKSVTWQEQVETKEFTTVKNKQVDPAELPLSARRVLFEKAFFGGNSTNISSDNCETMSVAQKAALFEKSNSKDKSSHPTKPTLNFAESRNKDYAKVSHTEKLPHVVNKQPPVISSNSLSLEPVSSSPNKGGGHTNQIKQQLFKDVNSRWQNNEISSRSKLERKQEMAALLNRWENASSTSAPKVLNDDKKAALPDNFADPRKDDTQDCDDSQVSDDSIGNSSKPSFAILNDCPNASKTDDIPSEIEGSESNSESNESYQEESEDWGNKEDTFSADEAENIAKEAVAVCEEIDELLDNALEDEVSSGDESDKTATPMKMSKFQGETRSVKSPTIQRSSNLKRDLPPTIIEGDKEVPLLHTISVYRRQKQELQLTPVKKIVRREKIEDPSSSDDDEKIAILQEKLKALHEEVLAQQTIISQASQALNLCHATTEFSGSAEQVEAERLLLIATQKRQAYLNEIHRLKTDKVLGTDDENTTGTLTLSDICLGVKREFLSARSDGKLENSVHYFICLIRYGAQLIATHMLSTEDRITENSLNFTNHITIQELRSDFGVSLEVYALKARKEVIPHDKKYHIKKDTSKLRLTPKTKKVDSRLISPAVSSPGGPNAVRTSNFGLVGFTRLTLHNVNRKSFILEKVPYISPLDGTLALKIQLHAKHGIVEKGFLTMFEDVSGFGAWHRRWCILQGNYLAYWKYPEDDKKKDPIGKIDLRQCITATVKLVSRDVCARPHTFQLVTIKQQQKGDKDSLITQCKDTVVTTKHLISADTKEERIVWCNHLNSTLSSIRKWDPDATQPIEHNK